MSWQAQEETTAQVSCSFNSWRCLMPAVWFGPHMIHCDNEESQIQIGCQEATGTVGQNQLRQPEKRSWGFLYGSRVFIPLSWLCARIKFHNEPSDSTLSNVFLLISQFLFLHFFYSSSSLKSMGKSTNYKMKIQSDIGCLSIKMQEWNFDRCRCHKWKAFSALNNIDLVFTVTVNWHWQ